MQDIDEAIEIAGSDLSLNEIDSAGVMNANEVWGNYFRHGWDTTTHRMTFGGNSFLAITYTPDNQPVAYEASGVRFWRLDGEIFVGRAS